MTIVTPDYLRPALLSVEPPSQTALSIHGSTAHEFKRDCTAEWYRISVWIAPGAGRRRRVTESGRGNGAAGAERGRQVDADPPAARAAAGADGQHRAVRRLAPGTLGSRTRRRDAADQRGSGQPDGARTDPAVCQPVPADSRTGTTHRRGRAARAGTAPLRPAVGRTEAAPAVRAVAGRQSGTPDPRRAHRRPRSGRASAVVAGDRGASGKRRLHPAVYPLPGGGGPAGRPGHGAASRQKTDRG